MSKTEEQDLAAQQQQEIERLREELTKKQEFIDETWATYEQALEKLSSLRAERDAAQRALEEARRVLRKHHDWQLGQTEPDERGIVLADAYAESTLCDETLAAMQAESTPATDTADDQITESEAQPTIDIMAALRASLEKRAALNSSTGTGVVEQAKPHCAHGEDFPCNLTGTPHARCDYTGRITPATLIIGRAEQPKLEKHAEGCVVNYAEDVGDDECTCGFTEQAKPTSDAQEEQCQS